ncbi:MAG: redox-sensing transcriptional repressor Rex [Candidatus Zixiibacteriota bacterium]|nr:MAG: redox-sensing transcriptional repressor Rex [candidate division Zixibacteria bacterium]
MKRVAESTIHRLSHYWRVLIALEKEGYKTVSSRELAQREKLTPAQVRKDLSFFGSFGTRGLGYPVTQLKEQVSAILGTNQTWRVALVGVGNMGSALVGYKEFSRQGFNIIKLFDNDQRKIGSFHKGLIISDVRNLEVEIKQAGIEIAIIAVPSAVAQQVMDEIAKGGVKAILNFASVKLKVPGDVCIRNEHMSMELEHLSFALVNKITGKQCE